MVNGVLMELENLRMDEFPSYQDWSRRYGPYETRTLPEVPTLRDWRRETLWRNDPDPRSDLIHPFVD